MRSVDGRRVRLQGLLETLLFVPAATDRVERIAERLEPADVVRSERQQLGLRGVGRFVGRDRLGWRVDLFRDKSDAEMSQRQFVANGLGALALDEKLLVVVASPPQQIHADRLHSRLIQQRVFTDFGEQVVDGLPRLEQVFFGEGTCFPGVIQGPGDAEITDREPNESDRQSHDRQPGHCGDNGIASAPASGSRQRAHRPRLDGPAVQEAVEFLGQGLGRLVAVSRFLL